MGRNWYWSVCIYVFRRIYPISPVLLTNGIGSGDRHAFAGRQSESVTARIQSFRNLRSNSTAVQSKYVDIFPNQSVHAL